MAYVKTSWGTGVDPKTGRPIENPEARYGETPVLITPTAQGAHNWRPMAFNPNNGLLYFPVRVNSYRLSDDRDWSYRSKGWNIGADFHARDGQKSGRLIAWDPVKQSEVWRHEYTSTPNGGVLSTAGGLISQGTSDGRFIAFKAKNGNIEWSFPTGTGVKAAPATYRISDVQYISILAGW